MHKETRSLLIFLAATFFWKQAFNTSILGGSRGVPLFKWDDEPLWITESNLFHR